MKAGLLVKNAGQGAVMTDKAVNAVQANIDNQIKMASLNARRALDTTSMMVNKYGLTGGEAATVTAGMMSAQQTQLSALKAQLNLKAKTELGQLIKDPSNIQRNDPHAVKTFINFLDTGIKEGSIQTASDIDSGVKDSLVALNFGRESLDELISGIFSGTGGTIDTTTWDSMRKSYSTAGVLNK